MSRGATVLPAALATVAVGAALGAAVADLARIEVVLARHRRAASTALFAADACLAETIAGLPPGWDFAALIAGPDQVRGTADDGLLAPPAGCSGRAGAAPGAAAPPRALLRLEARAGGGRRELEAAVGLDAVPGVPALLWLGALPPAALGGTIGLDGTDDGAPPVDWASFAAPDDPAALDAWLAAVAGHVTLSARTAPPLAAAPPPAAALATRARAAGAAGPEVLVPSAPPVALAHVAGDLVVADARAGAGLLVVEGALDIRGAFDFTGIVVVSGGVRIAAGGRLTVSGSLWIGAPPPPTASLSVDGSVAVRRDRPAVESADRLLALPRRVILLGLRDLG